MGTHTNSVLTLANSIIGVSVLAMPFCFKQCGIMLSLVLLLVSNVVTRLACYYLIKSALIEKRRNFEMLALRVLGPSGKLLVEVCLIGFLLGTCVAFFVVLGDLGAPLLAELIGAPRPADLRFSVLVGVGVFVVLPLGLLRSVRSLTSVCALSIAFYFCLALKVVGEAAGHLVAGDWFDKVEFWRPAGVLQCIPIFSMALSCQTQLFEVFDWTPPAPLERAYGAVRSAVNMTMLFYMAVGFFGYVAFCNRPFNGNLLVSFSPSAASMLVRAGFVMSLAASFPLVIFPCRASIYSLLFKKGAESGQMAERRLRWISAGVVGAALGAAVMVPSIETVLGLVGSTIGVLVCVILPAVIFISRSPSRPDTEQLLAKVLAVCGFVTMVLSTYANLYATDVAAGPVYVTEMAPPLRIVAPLVDSVVPAVAEKLAEPLVVHEPESFAVVAEPLSVSNTSADRPAIPPSPIIRPSGAEPKTKLGAEKPLEEVKKEENKVLDVKEEDEISRQEPPIPEEPRKPKKRIEDSVISKLREELRKRPILTLNEEMEKERKESKGVGKPGKYEENIVKGDTGESRKEGLEVKETLNNNKENLVQQDKKDQEVKETEDTKKRLEYERKKHDEEIERNRVKNVISDVKNKVEVKQGLLEKENSAKVIDSNNLIVAKSINNITLDESIKDSIGNLSNMKLDVKKVNSVNDIKTEERSNKKGKLLVERMEQGIPLPLAVGHRERREVEHCEPKTAVVGDEGTAVVGNSAEIVVKYGKPAAAAISDGSSANLLRTADNLADATLVKNSHTPESDLQNNILAATGDGVSVNENHKSSKANDISASVIKEQTIVDSGKGDSVNISKSSDTLVPIVKNFKDQDFNRKVSATNLNQSLDTVEAEFPNLIDSKTLVPNENIVLPVTYVDKSEDFKTSQNGNSMDNVEGRDKVSVSDQGKTGSQLLADNLLEDPSLNKNDAEISHVIISDKREELAVAESVPANVNSKTPAAVLLREEHRK